MKLGNSLGFLLFGLLMVTLPFIDPGLCPKDGIDGTSSRALWLDFMGSLQAGIGFCLMGSHVQGVVAAKLAVLRDARGTRRAHAPIFAGSQVDAR